MPGPVLGILGGMGPLASAEFLKTLYEAHQGKVEQETPVVVMRSDPRVYDRTTALLRDALDPALLAQLEAGLREVVRMGADEIVICCFTAHALLPAICSDLRAKVVSLVDIAFSELKTSPARSLLVCTKGSRRLRVFEGHPAWPAVQARVVIPDESDQDAIHELIYELKRGHATEGMLHWLAGLNEKYATEGMIVGCTEIHMLTKRLPVEGCRLRCVDPLTTLANRWGKVRMW